MKKFPSYYKQKKEHKTNQFRAENIATIMTAPQTVLAMTEYVSEKIGREFCVEIGVWTIKAIVKVIERNSLKTPPSEVN